ncbi:MAG: glutamyl-tRNA reductase [Caldimicrobium sp.]|nr:glutamyl-tRNA reductase [Caldimicrobium sp.]MCX7613118.1 glutamyl-tRNA reductase [Caldimicrobium sp.]MDW8183275.1 glutamyl-tRNA reductase [Caldimicrobium sp.]
METDFFLLLVGLNHKTAPVEIREKLSFSSAKTHPLERIKAYSIPFKEAFFLSTCNRVEFTFIYREEDRNEILRGFSSFLENEVGLTLDTFRPWSYFLEDEEVIRHLFLVACGLDSMVLGEPQILGQMKEAFKRALDLKTSGIVLNKLLHRAFFVAKKVRTETGIGGGAVSVSYAATQLAKKILGSLKDKKVLLIGAGEMAELACQHLLSFGASEILIANRTLSKAVELCSRFRGKAYSLEALPEVIIQADIIISSTGAPGFLITKALLSSLLKARKYRPLFIIDIAVPRDVEPSVNELENIYLFDIDDLKSVVEENFKNRQKEALRARAIVEEEVLKMKKWLSELSLHPTIKRLTERAEIIRKKELAKTLKKLKNLSEDEIESLDILTKSLVQKMLYYPIKFLKGGYHEEGRLAINLIREIYQLDELRDWEEEILEEDLNSSPTENLAEKEDFFFRNKKIFQ